MKKYPELRQLFGPERRSRYFGVALVFAQLSLSVWARDLPFWQLLLTSYVVGAALNHGMWVLVHECTHNLVFRKPLHNKLFSMFLNFPNVIPAALAFSKYHLLHHGHQGVMEYDADMPAHPEANFVGNSAWKKFLYMLFFTFIQGVVHPNRLKTVKLWDRWTIINLLVQVTFTSWFGWLFGGWAVVFLGLSTFFALGFHPLGGRWISEHYIVHEEQETNSYYGPLNKISFNVGYHNEHHDLPQVPWSRLPQVKQTAPEFYDGLYSYKSWGFALWKFITDSRATLFDRMQRSEETRKRKKETDC